MASSYESMMHRAQARIAALEAELAKRDALLDKRDSLLREALPHLHHTGATHHQQCACSVKRRIEAIIQAKGVHAP